MSVGQPAVVLNKEKFWNHLSLLYASWKKPLPGWNDAEALLVVCGGQDDEILYKKSSTIQLWLFGVEFLNTILLFTDKGLKICASKKMCAILQQLEDANQEINFELIKKDKSDKYVGNFDTLIKSIKSSHNPATGAIESAKVKKLGRLKQPEKGKFVEGFQNVLEDENFETVKFTDAISDLTMVKDDKELKTIKRAGEFTTKVLKYLQQKVEDVIEDDKTITHLKLSESLQKVLEDPKLVKSDLKADNLEECYDPIIQSGGTYSLKPSAQSDEKKLHYDKGTIICSVGYRLRDYCSNISRTFLIDASKEQAATYTLLVGVYKKVLQTLKHDAPLNKVFEAALKVVRKNKPELEGNFVRNVGWGMGLEFRDKHYVINKKSTRCAKTGMVFNINVGFNNLEDKSKSGKAATYALQIADTVIVTEDQPEFATHFQRKMIDYQLDGGSDDDDKEDDSDDAVIPAAANDGSLKAIAGYSGRVTRQKNQRRAQELQEEGARRKERESNQKILREKAFQSLKKIHKRSLRGENPFGKQTETKVYVDPECYKRPDSLPDNLKGTRVAIDLSKKCVLCPINGHSVPFHIQTIKNVSLSNTADYTYLRLNFVSPTASAIGGHRKQPDVVMSHPEAMFIKELTYRSLDKSNFERILKGIKELQKREKAAAKQTDNTPMVKQPKLNRTRDPARLRDLSCKPTLGGRKKGSGSLEAHANGLRFRDSRGAELDVIYANIKHAFFQPADKTAAVIIHFHLHNPIVCGKKKTQDFMVYHDVLERSEEIGRSGYDYDGIREEQEERKKRSRLNKLFRDWTDKCERTAKASGHEVEFDAPEMDLAFQGVPEKSTVTLYPTNKCIISLDDANPFVLTLADIEIAHFERVSFSLKSFDVVFIMKDFTKPVKKVCVIPREHLDTIQEFLNLQGIPYSQGQMTLDWRTIMNTIKADIGNFIESGGWDFLRQDQEDESDEEEPPVETAADDYVPDEEDWEDADESDEEYDSEDDYVSSEEDFDDEEEVSGEDWDELERKAREDDMKDRHRDADRQRSGRSGGGGSRKRRGSGGGGGSAKRQRRAR